MRIGTSSVVVAAFVGPGTVLTCAIAGLKYGYALGWVLLFAVGATFVLQSYAAALGILLGKGLGEAIRSFAERPAIRMVLFGLVILGLWVGSAAFEMGNLMGAAIGIQVLSGGEQLAREFILGLGVLAGLILLLQLHRLIHFFSWMVVGMAGLFMIAVLLLPVQWGKAVEGLFLPTVPEGSLVTIVALLGTTIVTYNLFLHASVTRAYWKNWANKPEAFRREWVSMAVFLLIGGLVSYAIMLVGAAMRPHVKEVSQVQELAILLEPVGGAIARYLFGLGLFAAGITSAVTAPMAAASGIQEILSPTRQPDSRFFRGIWLSVLGAGLFFGLLGWSPIQAIIAAQAANGVLLPLMAGFMVFLVRKYAMQILPQWYHILGYTVVGICAVLGGRMLWWVWTQLQ